MQNRKGRKRPRADSWGNRITRGVYRLLAGQKITGAQTGLRGFGIKKGRAFLKQKRRGLWPPLYEMVLVLFTAYVLLTWLMARGCAAAR